MSKHTPGPWYAEPINDEEDVFCAIFGPSVLNAAEEVEIAVLRASDPQPGHSAYRDNEGQANARLIAAAPDLLAACRHAMNVGEIKYKTCALSSYSHDILKAAIAKAEGREG
jgi:hypothetical protein